MVEVEDITQNSRSIKIGKEQSYQLMSQREYYEHRGKSDRIIALLVKLFFTCVYFLFASVYLLRYKEQLEVEFGKGLGFLVYSSPFWSFQRDAALLILGYLLMLFVLKKLLLG